jgi:hypothetical protein
MNENNGIWILILMVLVATRGTTEGWGEILEDF